MISKTISQVSLKIFFVLLDPFFKNSIFKTDFLRISLGDHVTTLLEYPGCSRAFMRPLELLSCNKTRNVRMDRHEDKVIFTVASGCAY